MNEMAVPRPNNLDAFWMPYTDNRYFKGNPRMLARAEGMSYFTPEGREVLDATAGLWCCNAGHGRREITEAIQKQAAEKHAPQRTVRFSPTALAITGSLVFAVIMASLITLNPITAFRMAYTNYAGEIPASVATEGTAPAATARQGTQESEKPAQ